MAGGRVTHRPRADSVYETIIHATVTYRIYHPALYSNEMMHESYNAKCKVKSHINASRFTCFACILKFECRYHESLMFERLTVNRPL
jgi:hypothetical protein